MISSEDDRARFVNTPISELAHELADKYPHMHERDIAGTYGYQLMTDEMIQLAAEEELATQIGVIFRSKQRAAEDAARKAAEDEFNALDPDEQYKRTHNGRTRERDEAAKKRSDDEFARRKKEIDDEFTRGIQKILDDVASKIRLEVTEELLSSVFALGDGRRVTWGEATVDDHKTRIVMLENQMIGTGQTASLHMKAIEMIQSNGVMKLADV